MIINDKLVQKLGTRFDKIEQALLRIENKTIRDRAVSNYTYFKNSNEYDGSIASAINCFSWGMTPEGGEYWRDVYSKCLRQEVMETPF